MSNGYIKDIEEFIQETVPADWKWRWNTKEHQVEVEVPVPHGRVYLECRMSELYNVVVYWAAIQRENHIA